MRKAMRKLLAFVSILLFLSCSNAEEQYTTSYPCYFVFRTDLHPVNILSRVVNNPGVFVKVTVTAGDVVRLLLSPNTGEADETVNITTAEEKRYGNGYTNVGANQSLIIGTTTTNELRAYDAQCPFCLASYGGMSYPLTWATNKQNVYCANCKRTYMLNSDGVSDDGHRMLQYRITYDGTAIVVSN